MKFENCIGHILKWEGGYDNNPSDPGGETKYGIDKRSHPTVDIKNLTLTDAIEIYRVDYWQKNRLDEMPVYLRLAYFDCVVNQGPGAAVKFLQRALGVKVDMDLGPVTLAALQKAGISIVGQFLSERFMHYVQLDTFSTFGKGWTKRLVDTTLESGKQLTGYGRA